MQSSSEQPLVGEERYVTTRITAAKETRPLVEHGNSHRTSEYQCLSRSRDKQQREKFSKENRMILSTVPYHLQVLTRVREMLIARAIPIMRVYIKPGGQKKRGYSGHFINLPQHGCMGAGNFFEYCLIFLQPTLMFN